MAVFRLVLPSKQRVVGSNPARGTISFSVLFSISPNIYCDEMCAATENKPSIFTSKYETISRQVADLLTVFSCFVWNSVRPSLQCLNRLQYDPKMKAGSYLYVPDF